MGCPIKPFGDYRYMPYGHTLYLSRRRFDILYECLKSIVPIFRGNIKLKLLKDLMFIYNIVDGRQLLYLGFYFKTH